MIETSFFLPLILLSVQGCFGALDTLYYHEWRHRLPANAFFVALELRLHGVRDLIYGVLFCALPRLRFQGIYLWLLVGLLLAEIVITLWDFVIERRIRIPLGGLPNGELVMHTVMAIIYGAFLATLFPHLMVWANSPTALVPHSVEIAPWLVLAMTVMGIGVTAAGVRDLWYGLKKTSVS
jgi:hypothetical protein